MLDAILKKFGLDAAHGGLYVVNEEELIESHVPCFPPTLNALILAPSTTVHLQSILLVNYPVDHQVQLLRQNAVKTLCLGALAEEEGAEALLIPRRKGISFAEDFQEIIAQLRAPDGCPWDRKQTHDSLRMFILEEVYELFDALDENHPQEIAEELGDVMLQLFLHAQIGAEAGEFTLLDVFSLISEKMRRRHPHVFADVEVNGDVNQVLDNWQAIKAQERQENGNEKKKGALDGVSQGLPALLQAQHYQQRAILNGFDWDSAGGALDKVREEFEEVITATNQQELAEEFGDLLFALVRVISDAGFEAEVLLRAANQKFYARYVRMEEKLAEQGLGLTKMTEAQKVALWNSVKV